MLCSETKGKPVFKDLPVTWKQIKPHWQNPVHSNEAETGDTGQVPAAQGHGTDVKVLTVLTGTKKPEQF